MATRSVVRQAHGAAAAPPSNMTVKRVQREIRDLRAEDLGGIRLGPESEANLLQWTGIIPGPEGSLYANGFFEFKMTLPNDYPFSAPRIVFSTRIYHMNISDQGHICLDILKNMWSPALSLFKVVLSLSSLLTDPNPADPLGVLAKQASLPFADVTSTNNEVPSIANEYKTNRAKHDTTARNWTNLYAMKQPPHLLPSAPITPSSTPIPPSLSSSSVALPRRLPPQPPTTTATHAESSRGPSSNRPGARPTPSSDSTLQSRPSAAVVIEISDSDSDEGTNVSRKRKRSSSDKASSAKRPLRSGTVSANRNNDGSHNGANTRQPGAINETIIIDDD